MTAYDNDIWVYLESADGAVSNVSYEILGKARELAGELDTGVTAVLVGAGDDLDGLAEAAIARGADGVVQIEHDLLDVYRPETYVDAVEEALREGDPAMFLSPATNDGIGLAGRLAVRLHAGLNADVVRLEVDDDGSLVGGVPAFAGGILAMVKAKGRPQMSTVRPGVFTALEPDDSREGDLAVREPDLSADDILTEVLDREVGETVDLPGADVVVCAGRGFDGDLELARELTEALDATLGVTRPLCDEGLVSRERQIGSTGYSLQADVAICAGISGSVYFTSGLDDVDTVIAVNTDPEEPIFDHADYCIEGDLFEVLPPLIEQLEAEGVISA
ncbi:electron transfer flavoprotein alpha subunit [Halalkaliarchaeum desulfuricum]|uniref:Electron transfer flavoprotein alpha subunit n=1 Tax=Halalkaliarchaeum desulfuricum TaxID=2055893 RepID=A0A343TK61_9EURY|nr:electron transfer flavoprotein subunit alpha/FixB family protein [Halalkaliarchaeum desulfuricum]AUX09483.1 electron transfer flavoprotein alpha subunit [Halalkaliarchaeum desulfuricum]